MIKYMLILFMFVLCQNQNKSENGGEEWIKNFKLKGGELFYDFDYYNLSGVRPYNKNYLINSSYIYGIIKSSSEISIFKINYENKKIEIENRYLYLRDNYYVTTEILSEMNLSVFNRIVSIYKKDVIIEYNYIISSQKEYLNNIVFKYKTGLIREYVNQNNSYINYEFITDENSKILKNKTFEGYTKNN